jgi:hypothetical protein
MHHRKRPIFFGSSTYAFWCESVDVGMAVRMCGLNLGFGSVDCQQDFFGWRASALVAFVIYGVHYNWNSEDML